MTATKTVTEKLLKKMPGGKVLDVATGKGNFAFTMEHCFTACSLIVAVDTAALSLISMVKERKSRKITPSAMDGSLLAFQNNTFNTVAISNSLHHLKEPEIVLQEMKRTLAPGGYFIVTEMFCDGNQTSSQHTHTLLHNWWAATDSENGTVHNPVFTQNELRNFIKRVGLIDLEFYVSEDLSGDPFDSKLMEYLDITFKSYSRRGKGNNRLVKLGEEAMIHLKKHGFTNARSLIAVGLNPG
ncbi:MAG: methyltransferase domain-containing protein [Candidatus Sabulitectum sp.]|nr:methyltransferase domain-containing protein [Candidatus Sabulitectum sp.]